MEISEDKTTLLLAFFIMAVESTGREKDQLDAKYLRENHGA